MAIYKPSNCAPFLSAQDLTQPFSISCELNTSNERVTGYKLKILDSLNNAVFEGQWYDPITESNGSGLNGSVLTLPVVIDGDGTLNHNTIQYNKTTEKYTVKTGVGAPKFNEELFKNGYPNQPYKWIITLAQGQKDNNNKFIQQPTDPKYFDMEITSGTVLGSTPNRIQSNLSENIQKDYFIQLYKTNENNEIVPLTNEDSSLVYRQPITSYDHTYGYIYPQENKFTKKQIEDAKYFKIYKFSNDPEVVAAGSKVVLVRNAPMQSVEVTSGTQTKQASEVWGTGSDTYPYYFTQKYQGFSSKPDISSLPCSSFDNNINSDNVLVVGSTIIVNGENQQKYNGVFTLQAFKVDEIKTKKEYTEITTYNLTIQWLRAASADTWAELVNNVYLVELGKTPGARLQVTVEDDKTGVINETPIKFGDEKPIVLRTTNGVDITHDEIFKNSLFDEHIGDGGNRYMVTYIRPFDGITRLQRFDFLESNSTTYTSLEILSVNSNVWRIQTSGNERKTPLIPDETKYKITSFFKSSEENPFYAYADPTVEITSDFVTETIENPIFVINNRLATLNGIFSQDNNKSWVYYQWRMTDLTIGTETITEKGFDGEIAWTIYGLQNKHYYQVELYIQDEFGRVASKEITFQVQVEISEKKPFFEVEFDCETNSYKINTTSTGVVIPGLENRILRTKISENGTEDQPFAVQEEQMEDFVAKGDDGEVYEFQVTDPFETIRDLVVDQGGNSDVYNYVLLKAEKNGNAIDNYNAGYNYNPEDKSYSLYVTDLDEPATSSDNLFSYNKMKGDSGGKSLIPAPKNDTITINFSNILNNYFEGQVMSYHIGVDSPSTAFNDIEVRVSVTPEIITSKETGLKEVSPDRNKIKVGIYQCLKTTNENNNTTTHKPDVLIREKEFVFYGNPNPRKVCSPWVNPARGAADSNCDYIETDVVYDKDGKKIEGGLNINGEGRYNSNSEISKPITLTKSIENPNTYAVWYDKTTELLNQADGSNINYFRNYWGYCDKVIYYKNINLKLDGNENNLFDNYWNDYTNSESPIYRQTSINLPDDSHTGEEIFTNKNLTFSLILSDYNTATKQFAPLEINGRLWNGDKEVPLTEITK